MIRPAVLALCLAAACSEPASRVRLLRIGGACGAAGDARTLLIRALGDEGEVSRAVSVGEVAELDDLPAATRQLTVEVLGAGGAVRAIGKTAPLAFGELQTGEDLAVAMAPPGTACPTEALVAPRWAPVVARAGRYVLLVGGQGPQGQLATAELYDPQTDRFEPVEVPPRLAQFGTFLGAVATSLPDGRVVLSGGPAGSYAVFDPATRRFGPPILLEPRFFHGAIAVGGDRIVVAGGCLGLAGAVCNTSASRTTFQLAVDTDEQTALKTLERDHVQPTLLLDPGLGAGLGAGPPGEAGRAPTVLVVGSVTTGGLPAETADRLDLGPLLLPVAVPGTYAAAAPLDSGAVLTGFASGQLGAVATAAVLPTVGQAQPMDVGQPRLRAASITLLEDGSALALGEGDGGAATAALYRPGQHRWQAVALPAEVTGLGGHRAVRLDDGSVLILGAGTAAAPATTAWRYRPPLAGPFSASAVALPSDDRAELTPSEPDAASRPGGRYTLAGSRAGLSQWTLVGGPRLVDGRLTATLRIPEVGDAGDGFAVISHFESPAALVVTQLVAGQPATLSRHAAGQVTELCRGQPVPAHPADEATALEWTARGGAVTVRLGGAVVLSCTAPELPRGAWGLGVVGAGARLGIDALSVER